MVNLKNKKGYPVSIIFGMGQYCVIADDAAST